MRWRQVPTCVFIRLCTDAPTEAAKGARIRQTRHFDAQREHVRRGIGGVDVGHDAEVQRHEAVVLIPVDVAQGEVAVDRVTGHVHDRDQRVGLVRQVQQVDVDHARGAIHDAAVDVQDVRGASRPLTSTLMSPSPAKSPMMVSMSFWRAVSKSIVPRCRCRTEAVQRGHHRSGRAMAHVDDVVVPSTVIVP
jgi:hypothetical protein